MKVEKEIRLRIERNTAQVSRFESVSIIIACAVALAWMTELQNYPVLILGPAAAFLKLAPIWYQVYFPIVLLTVAEIVRAIINLVRPDWVLFRGIVRVIAQAGGLAVVYFLIKAGTWVTAAGSMTEGGGNSARTLQIINQCFLYGLVGAAIYSGVMIVVRITQLIRQSRGQSGSGNMGAPRRKGIKETAMLHTLFFVLSFFMDYRGIAAALSNSSLLGLVNAGVLCLAGIGVYLRNWLANRRGDVRAARPANNLLLFQK
jgi:hypothetical protein